MAEKKYTEDHEWTLIDDDIATVGITDHAQESLGDIVFIDLPSVGKIVKAKEEICVIESVKAASDIYSPLDGEILEVNQNLSNDAALINHDAEGKGWIFKIKMSNDDQLKNLMSQDQYLAFLDK